MWLCNTDGDRSHGHGFRVLADWNGLLCAVGEREVGVRVWWRVDTAVMLDPVGILRQLGGTTMGGCGRWYWENVSMGTEGAWLDRSKCCFFCLLISRTERE